jgi:hypothetical protein
MLQMDLIFMQDTPHCTLWNAGMRGNSTQAGGWTAMTQHVISLTSEQVEE